MFCLILDNSDSSSRLASVWASYIFVFVAVLITFSIVFAVGFMVNAMAYNSNQKITAKMFNAVSIFSTRSVVIKYVSEILNYGNFV